jgi:sulfate adenylyltransferase
MNEIKVKITRDQYLEVEKIALGVFFPLTSFMNEADYNSCIEKLELTSGEIFPIPIVFDINKTIAEKVEIGTTLNLFFQDEHVANLNVNSTFSPNKESALLKIFGTNDHSHPGIKYFLSLEEYFVSGNIQLIKRAKFEFEEYELTPDQTKEYFNGLGWKSIVGFQTRNVPHRAHEYLQRIALEHVDGILIQPLVGKKKKGDYTPLAVIRGYEAQIKHYFPPTRAKLAILSTVMRYAGPREAIFHAIIRRNYGCTHFIVGRDHAGVGNFYDKYAAHELISKYEDKLGIKIFKLCGPFYCQACDGIVTEKTCKHYLSDPEKTHEISGTMMRKMLSESKSVEHQFMRKEVIDALSGIEIFIDD